MDDTGDVTLLRWDRENYKLIGKTALELKEENEKARCKVSQYLAYLLIVLIA